MNSNKLIFYFFILSFSFWIPQSYAQINYSYKPLDRSDEFLLEVATSIKGDIIFTTNPDYLESRRRVIYTPSPNGMLKLNDGEIKWYHFSRNGYLYLREKDYLKIKTTSGHTRQNYNTAQLKKVGMKSPKLFASSPTHLFFLSGFKTILKVPIREGYIPEFEKAITIAIPKNIQYWKFGVDDNNNLYGIAKNKQVKHIDIMAAKYHAVINKIEDNGTSKAIKTFEGFKHGDRPNIHVSFLHDGRFLIKMSAKTAIIVSNDGQNIMDLGTCRGCNFMNRNTQLDESGRLLSVIRSGLYKDRIYVLMTTENLTANEVVAKAVDEYKKGEYDAANQLAELALEKDNNLADAYFVRGLTKPGFRLNSNLTFKVENYKIADYKIVLNNLMAKFKYGGEKGRAEIEKSVTADLILAINKGTKFKGEAFNQLGLINFANGNFSMAFKHFYSARLYRFKGPYLNENIVETGIRAGKGIKVMLPQVEGLIKKDPKNADGYFFKGALYYHEKDYQKARQYFKQAYELRENGLFAYNLGVVNAIFRDEQKACSYFKIAFANRVSEAHYYLYKNCEFSATRINCNICSGDGLDTDYKSRRLRLPNTIPKACWKCEGTGDLYLQPKARKMKILYR